LLADKGVAFEDRNVSRNPAYLDELREMGFSSIPVTVIGDQRIVGYDPARIEAALKAS
jgi:glutaredoxin